LEQEDWTTQREHPPFLTWMALSWQARPESSEAVEGEAEIFAEEIKREKKTLLRFTTR